ncbi:MAG: hypothetical protein ACOZCO_09020 [Bacteroidota bacterium]
MKKALLFAGIILFSTMSLNSCKSRKGDKCPAYSQAVFQAAGEAAQAPEK